MVEANTQLLAGAAVTVFLALLFFGVVVLWDVALALRSVGDKIDKLEDNIDDDLTDISHHLDGMSNAPGGGGTQLHLNGGAISSGPGPAQPQQAPRTGQPQAEAAGRPASDQPPTGGVGPQPEADPRSAEHRSRAARREDEPSERESETDSPPEPPASDADSADPDGDDPQSDDRADESDPDEQPVDEPEASETSTADADDEPAEQPRAERNRGRFITSPDRTAWYATPLDREAIAAARPAIAGALPDGSEPEIDEADVIAAGPVGSSPSAATETDGAGVETVPEGGTDVPTESNESLEQAGAGDGEDGTEPIDDGDGPSDGSTGEATGSADADVDSDATSDALEDEPGDEAGDSDDESVADPTADAADGLEEAVDEPPTSTDDIDALSFDEAADDGGDTGDESDPTAADESAGATGDESTGVPDLREGSTGLESTADESASENATDIEPDDAAEAGSDTAGDVESGDGEPAETDDGDAGSGAAADALSAFEFDDGEFEADDDVTVEEAVDTMNEDAPAPELSSHRFDVTAEETDDGGAVVTLSFETGTVDITGSTKRLLQYQMQSFADRESTPDGDVTIGRNRIVIELPHSDGNAVQQWGEAAVSIVDRTLYLSDNSPDS